MKYYVRKDASSEIEGPFDLAAIQGWIAGGRFTTDYQGLEDRGQSIERMKESRKWIALEEIFAQPAPAAYEQTPEAFLAALRERSCYKGLRLCVDLLAIAGWGVCGWWIFLLGSIPAGAFVSQLIYVGLVSIGVAVLRLIAVLLADIGDVLIEQNRKK